VALIGLAILLVFSSTSTVWAVPGQTWRSRVGHDRAQPMTFSLFPGVSRNRQRRGFITRAGGPAERPRQRTKQPGCVRTALRSLSRQTGLLLVPLVVLWAFRDPGEWQNRSLSKRVALCFAVTAIAAGVYGGTAAMADRILCEPRTSNILRASGPWLASTSMLGSGTLSAQGGSISRDSPRMLSRDRTPINQSRPDSRRGLMLLFGTACVWAQPVLAGPATTGGSAERLFGIGLLPLLLALAIRLRDAKVFSTSRSVSSFAAACGLIGLASFTTLPQINTCPSPASSACSASCSPARASGYSCSFISIPHAHTATRR